MIRFFIAALIVYMLFVAYMVVFQRSFMYFPITTAEPDIRVAPGMQWISVQTADGLTLRGWYQPAADVKPTFLFFHGNARNIEIRADKARAYTDAGYGMLLASYRGYGGNPGEPSEEGLYADGRAYLDWLLASGVEAGSIVLYGESLGTAVAVQMATEYDVKAVILETPFSSALDLAKANYPFIPFIELLLKDQYLSDEKIAAAKAPIFFGVAGQDFVTPPRFGRALYEAAREPKRLRVYGGASHFDLYDRGFGRDVLGFIELLEIQSSEH